MGKCGKCKKKIGFLDAKFSRSDMLNNCVLVNIGWVWENKKEKKAHEIAIEQARRDVLFNEKLDVKEQYLMQGTMEPDGVTTENQFDDFELVALSNKFRIEIGEMGTDGWELTTPDHVFGHNGDHLEWR